MLKKELIDNFEKQERVLDAVKLRLNVAIDDVDKATAEAGKLDKKVNRLKEAIRSRLIVIEPEQIPLNVIEQRIDRCEIAEHPEISEEIKLLRYLQEIICRNDCNVPDNGFGFR